MKPAICIDGRHIQDHFPGIGRYAYNLIDGLGRIAPEEKFAVLYNPGSKNSRYDVSALGRYPNIELVQTYVPTISVREQFQLPATYYQLFHSPYFIKPFFLRTPSVVTLYDLIPLRAPRGVPTLARLLFRAILALGVRTAARILVPSHSTRNDLIAALGIPPERIAVTPLAADARFVPIAAPERERVRTKYSLPDRYILYVGINKPHKNLEALLAAVERAGSDAALVIAGAWDERYEAGLDQKSGVRFLPNIADADLPGLYASAAVFVFPSLYEGFGLPLLEAMACGAPCISSKAASLPEVGGDAPLYFDPYDVDELAQLIARVAGDGALQDEMRRRSLAQAKHFSWEQTAQATLDVYRSVGGGVAAASPLRG